MVYYEYSVELDIVAARYVYEVTAQQVISGLRDLVEDPSIPKNVKLIILSEGVIPVIHESELNEIIDAMTKTLQSFDSFTIGFIQNDPQNAALALLFSSRLEKRTDYKQEIFSSPKEASKWLASFSDAKSTAPTFTEFLNDFLNRTPKNQ